MPEILINTLKNTIGAEQSSFQQLKPILPRCICEEIWSTIVYKSDL